MEDRGLFRCYSSPLMKHLKNNGCRYEFVAKDIVNNKTFWLFIKDDTVSALLKSWNELK